MASRAYVSKPVSVKDRRFLFGNKMEEGETFEILARGFNVVMRLGYRMI